MKMHKNIHLLLLHNFNKVFDLKVYRDYVRRKHKNNHVKELKSMTKKLIHYQNVDETLDVVFGLQVYQSLVFELEEARSLF